jgi:hypothetical protein
VLALLAALPALPAEAADARWRWPLRGEVITRYHNGSDPYAGGQHRGIDIAGSVGEPVTAAVAGTVRFAGVAGSSGVTVSVRTADGRYDTSYLHLSSLSVRKGDRVGAGRRLGAVGTTGRRSAERPHLHFGVRDAGTTHAYRDPLRFLPPLPGPGHEPEGPRGAPAPVTAPRRPAPVPAPLPRPDGAPAGHRVPVRRPVPSPGRRPLPAPDRRPAPEPSQAPAPLVHGGPAEVPARALDGVLDPRWQPSRGPEAWPAPRATAESGRNAEPARPVAPAHSDPGPDFGWALACLGLLLAAAFLGGADEGRAVADRGRARVAAALRPRFGRG